MSEVTVITGNRIQLYQARVLLKALELYAKGIKVNTAYTPKNMVATANNITGCTTKNRRDAESALRKWLVIHGS